MTYNCTCHNKVRLTLDEAFDLAEVKADIEWTPVLKAELSPPNPAPLGQWTQPAIHVHLPDHLTTELTIPEPNITVNVSELKPPDVYVKAPVVNLPAPVVNVPAPIVNVAAAKATTPQEVIVTAMPDRLHKAVRGADGKITGSVEGDA